MSEDNFLDYSKENKINFNNLDYKKKISFERNQNKEKENLLKKGI
jgi:hypothetical protein